MGELSLYCKLLYLKQSLKMLRYLKHVSAHAKLNCLYLQRQQSAGDRRHFPLHYESRTQLLSLRLMHLAFKSIIIPCPADSSNVISVDLQAEVYIPTLPTAGSALYQRCLIMPIGFASYNYHNNDFKCI